MSCCLWTSMMRAAGWACFLLVVVSAEHVKLYRKVGDEVVLKPDAASVTGTIKGIIWRDGPNLAMEWDEGSDPDSFRHFKDRGRLDNSSGEMTITGLTRDDSQNYTVEINRSPAGSVQLIVISPVPTPSVTTSCEDETSCVLTCDGNTDGAEPFNYTWHLGDRESPESKKQQHITKEDSSSIAKFSCELRNPVSQERSPPIANPFITPTEPPAAEGLKVSTGLTVFISLLAAVLVLVLFHRWKAGMWFFHEESMPWEAGFWSRQERPPRDAAESNGTTARHEKGDPEEETPMA